MNNSKVLTQEENRSRFSVAITTKKFQELINNTLKDPGRVQRFIGAITSAVAVSPTLQTCNAGSILACALLGESLGLSPSPQLGQYYMIPFKQKEKKDRNGEIIVPADIKAQFVIGYKGYIQLAIRSGYYKKLNVIEIKRGELIHFDPLNEIIDCIMIDDFEEREAAETIGYYAMFEYLNGFRKAIYWTKEKMVSHADKYSPAFWKDAADIKSNGKTYHRVSYVDYEKGNYDKADEWMYSSFWYKNFDDMAKKTMIRQLISKWGVMSTEMQQAFDSDTTISDIGQSGEIISNDEDLGPLDSSEAAVSPTTEQVDLNAL